MAKPEGAGGVSGVSRSCRLGLVSLGVAVLAAAGLAVCVMCLDARRQDQLTELSHQLDMLRQLVDNMQKQLDRHEDKINATLHGKRPVSSEPEEEVVYEDEYEYDDEEGSYEEYEDEEHTPKAPVKRTTILGESTPSGNSTWPESRTRRDVRARVPVREDSATESLGTADRPAHSQHNNHPSRSTVYQEQRRAPESVVRLRHGGRNRNSRTEDIELVSQNSPEEFAPPVPHATQHLLSALFVGDASNYNIRDHAHYYGNNILYHPHGHFKDWVPASWMTEVGADLEFPIHNGKLTIEKPGIYFIYAQIYYTASHDRCGFHIKHNGEEVAQCITMTTGRVFKRNTCFTAVTLRLHKSDMVWISEVEGFRNTSFKNSHSFFGLIQLNSI